MAIKFVCDACGQTLNRGQEKTVKTDNKVYDICSNCNNRLTNFLENGAGQKKENKVVSGLKKAGSEVSSIFNNMNTDLE